MGFGSNEFDGMKKNVHNQHHIEDHHTGRSRRIANENRILFQPKIRFIIV